MSSKKLHITDERLLKVMAYVVSNKINGVSSKKDFCLSIGASSTNLFHIRNAHQQFQKDQILLCCQKYGISADYIFGFTKNMHSARAAVSPIERIREALNEIELTAKSL